MMKKFKKGQILTYHDTGEVSRVKVIEDKSNEEELDIILENIEVLKESSVVIPQPPGYQFIAWANRKYYSQCGWYIEEEPEEENI